MDTYLVLCKDCLTCQLNKNTQGYCQPTIESICFILPLHTHDEDHFLHPQILKLASGTHTEWILNGNKKQNENYQKVTKKLLQRPNSNSQINSRFTPATNLKIGKYVLIPNFEILQHKKEFPKNYNHSKKDRIQ